MKAVVLCLSLLFFGPALAEVEPSAGTSVEEADGTRPDEDEIVTVQPDDTLSTIAQRLARRAGVSTWKMMRALFEANPEAFYRNSMDNLRAKARLRVPTAAELEGTAPPRGAQTVVRPAASAAPNPSAAAPEEPAPEQPAPQEPPQGEPPAPAAEPGREAQTAAAPKAAPETREAALALLSPSEAVTAMPTELSDRLRELRAYTAKMQESNERLRTRLAKLEQKTHVIAEQVLALDEQQSAVDAPDGVRPVKVAARSDSPIAVAIEPPLPPETPEDDGSRLRWGIGFAFLLSLLALGGGLYLRHRVPTWR